MGRMSPKSETCLVSKTGDIFPIEGHLLFFFLSFLFYFILFFYFFLFIFFWGGGGGADVAIFNITRLLKRRQSPDMVIVSIFENYS